MFSLLFLKQKLQKGDNDIGVYDALEYIQNHGAKKVRKFWRCVDQEHILQHYPQLSEIVATLRKCEKSSVAVCQSVCDYHIEVCSIADVFPNSSFYLLSSWGEI